MNSAGQPENRTLYLPSVLLAKPPYSVPQEKINHDILPTSAVKESEVMYTTIHLVKNDQGPGRNQQVTVPLRNCLNIPDPAGQQNLNKRETPSSPIIVVKFHQKGIKPEANNQEEDSIDDYRGKCSKEVYPAESQLPLPRNTRRAPSTSRKCCWELTQGIKRCLFLIIFLVFVATVVAIVLSVVFLTNQNDPQNKPSPALLNLMDTYNIPSGTTLLNQNNNLDSVRFIDESSKRLMSNNSREDSSFQNEKQIILSMYSENQIYDRNKNAYYPSKVIIYQDPQPENGKSSPGTYSPQILLRESVLNTFGDSNDVIVVNQSKVKNLLEESKINAMPIAVRVYETPRAKISERPAFSIPQNNFSF